MLTSGEVAQLAQCRRYATRGCRMRYGWSSRRRYWEYLIEVAGDKRWRNAPLQRSRSTDVPPDPGVYVLCARPPGSKHQRSVFGRQYTVVYAGKAERPSGGLRARFVEHCSRPKQSMEMLRRCFKEGLDFWCLIEADPARRSLLEGLLVECFGPILNDISPPGMKILLTQVAAREPA